MVLFERISFNTSNVGIGTAAPICELHLHEITGSFAGSNSGTLTFTHGNTSGAQSIVFKSANSGNDYGYIEYRDNTSNTSFNYFNAANTESGALIIGCENDSNTLGPDSIILAPRGNTVIDPRNGVTYVKGNVGIGTTIPSQTIDVRGNAFVGTTAARTSYGVSGTSNVIQVPVSNGTINGVNITTLNRRTRASYATATNCVSTWISRAVPAVNNWTSVCWAPELSLFVAVSSGATLSTVVMTSPDGITWTARSAPENNSWQSVCWSPELSLFVAVASTGTNRIMTSSNGTTWSAVSAPEQNSWNSVCWSSELLLFVAVSGGTGSNRIMTSSNGTTWTLIAPPASNNWLSVCWSPELSLFVAVTSNGTINNSVMTSSDGTVWASARAAAQTTWISVCWSPELSMFVAVATTGQIMSSYNGTTWTSRTSPSVQSWNAVCWCPNISLFVAVSPLVAITSFDGITWISRTIPSYSWTSICWSPELSIVVAVSNTGNISAGVMTSLTALPAPLNTLKAPQSQVSIQTTSGYVGIGTTNPQYILDVNGVIKSKIPAFNYSMGSSQTTVAMGVETLVPFATSNIDTTSRYDKTAGNYKYTPNVAGIYQFNWNVNISASTNTGTMEFYTILYKNGAHNTLGTSFKCSGVFWDCSTGSALLYMNGSTDYVQIYVKQNSGGNATLNAWGATAPSQFSGFLVSAT